MKRIWQLAMTFGAAVAIVSAASHLTVRWLKIKVTASGYNVYGPVGSKPTAVLFGSSPTFDGLDWSRISSTLGATIETRGTMGSSPSEWETTQPLSPGATRTFIGISPVDEDEYYLCDFRAEIVPLSDTLRDLSSSHYGLHFARRLLSQYPLMFARKLFPTAGRSDGVILGIRRELQRMTGRSFGVDAGAAPGFGAGGGKSEITEKITDWPEARVERRVSVLQQFFEGHHGFDGPKRLALLRILRQAKQQGEVTLVVLPNSPIYQDRFMTPDAMRQFDTSIDELARTCPGVSIVRLDRVQSLHNNDMFYDLIHMNMYGQQIAMGVFLDQLKQTPPLQLK
jgi:hypothetical protein